MGSFSLNKIGELMNRDLMARSAVAGLLSLGLVAGNSAFAQDKKDVEQCWGVTKAGQNDCGSNKTSHSCAGQSKKDYDANDFRSEERRVGKECRL